MEEITIPVKDLKDPRGWSLANYPILLPHRIIAYLWDGIGIRIPQEDIDTFWQVGRETGDPRLRGFIEREDNRNRIPIGLYGDSAQLLTQYRTEKWLGLFLDVCHFRPLSIRASRFLLFSIDDSLLLQGGKTMNSVLRHIVWSCNALHEGKNPVLGPGSKPLLPHQEEIAGTPISTAFPHLCWSVTELRGDWRYHKETWRFNSSWQADFVCFRCPARTKGPFASRYYNCSTTASWLTSEYTLDEFISNQLPPVGN